MRPSNSLTASVFILAVCRVGAADDPQLETLGVSDGRREAAAASAGLEVYPGLEAKLYAAEPQMLSPTNIDVDHRGRVWVVEVMNYGEHAKQNLRPEGDRILILEDQDGDGAADLQTVFYQGRDVDSAMGLCVLGNKVIVTRAPNIIVFTDENGDDKPDKKEMLFTESGGVQGDHSLHSFSFGPDGKYYWNMGNSGRVVRDAAGSLVKDILDRPVVDRAAQRGNEALSGLGASPFWGGMVFRCDRDGSQFEVLGHNFRNNYEATVDSFGNVWQTDNDDDGNRGCRINFILEGGNYGYLDEMSGAGWRTNRTGQHAEVPHRHWHQNDPGVVPNFMVTGAGAPTGLVVYEGTLLPQLFHNQVISCDAGPGVVWAAIAKQDGAGFEGQLVSIVKGTRDRWCRPVDVAVGPDGALYISDWYDPYVGWNRQGDLRRGRIFRIAPPGHIATVPKYDYTTPAGATLALASPNASIRYQAWIALHDMQVAAEPALLRLFASSNARMRARALWLLSKIDGRGLQHLARGAKDADPNVRAVAIRASRQLKIDQLPILESLAHDLSAVVRRECAIAIRDLESPMAPKLWARLAAQHDGTDRWYLEALGIGAESRWAPFLAAWFEEVGPNWDTPQGRDLIWRSRADATPSLLSHILRRSELTEADAMRYLRSFDFLAETESKQHELRRLAAYAAASDSPAAAIIGAESIFRIRDFAASDEHDRAVIEAVLAKAGDSPLYTRVVQHFRLSEHYPALLEKAIEDPSAPFAVQTVRAMIESDQVGIVGRLLVGDDTEVGVKVARLLGDAGASDAADLLEATMLNDQMDQAVRIECVRSLVRAGEPHVLVNLATAGKFPKELEATAARALVGTLNVRLRAAAGTLFSMPPTKDNRPLPQMTDLIVFDGEANRGRQIFASATCASCHKAEGKGVDFGPDLSSIGSKLSKLALYDAILNPSSGVATSYQAFQVITESGKLHLGLIVSETDSSLSLKVPGGQVIEIAQDDVAEKAMLAVSAMPNGLLQLMTLDELIDLVEYLTTLKSDPPF